jgi:hypothetical protein
MEDLPDPLGRDIPRTRTVPASTSDAPSGRSSTTTAAVASERTSCPPCAAERTRAQRMIAAPA